MSVDKVNNPNPDPDSPVAQLMAFLDSREVTYWIDKKGIFSGSQFSELITTAEWKCFINMCNWKWIKVNGVSGYKVTGWNGKSIFYPALGCRDGNDLIITWQGHYWSLSLDSECSNGALRCRFTSDLINPYGNGGPHYCFSVRLLASPTSFISGLSHK